jgi:hypothetical protein
MTHVGSQCRGKKTVTTIPTIATAHRHSVVTMVIIKVTKTRNSLRGVSLIPTSQVRVPATLLLPNVEN